MADLKTNVVAAWESTLSSALASGATTINVTDTTGAPAVPFYVVIDPGNDAKRETVLVDSAKTATTFTLTASSKRGQDGSSDVAHDSGAIIAIVPTAANITDLHDRVDAKAADAEVVKLAGAQTITGAKTFSTDPILADGSSALSVTEGNAAYEAKQVEEGFRAYRSTVQSLAAGTATKIIWDTEVRDDGADYDPATGEWTVPATGWYDVAAGLYFASLADGNQVVLQVYVNGTSHTRLTSPYTGAAGSPMVSGAVPLHLTAGDVVSVYAVRSSAGDVGGTSLPSVLNYFTAKRRY